MTTEIAGQEELAAQLAELGARGELALYDDGCGVRLFELPSLEETGDDRSGCTPRGAVSPDGAVTARCAGDVVELFAGGGFVRRVPGCAPAWRPDGTLTVARQAVVVADSHELLIPRAELERAARFHPAIPDRSARVRAFVEGLAWITDTRAAVAISPRLRGVDLGPVGTIAFFEDGRLLPTAQPQFRVTGGPLATSPRGTYVTQTADLILRADGSLLALPKHLKDARAHAWSPDERFLALATRFAVVVVDVVSLERYDRTGGGLRSVTLPLRVTELAWR